MHQYALEGFREFPFRQVNCCRNLVKEKEVVFYRVGVCIVIELLRQVQKMLWNSSMEFSIAMELYDTAISGKYLHWS